MKRQDLTQGVIWKQLLLFALPLLASSFIQQLYNTVDLLFAGTLGKEATAAVGASSLVITCVVRRPSARKTAPRSAARSIPASL